MLRGSWGECARRYAPADLARDKPVQPFVLSALHTAYRQTWKPP